jgi:Golgi nucleoside diphosphatase
MLKNGEGDAILKSVEKHLVNTYPFPLVDNGVSIMGGDDEGGLLLTQACTHGSRLTTCWGISAQKLDDQRSASSTWA